MSDLFGNHVGFSHDAAQMVSVQSLTTMDSFKLCHTQRKSGTSFIAVLS